MRIALAIAIAGAVLSAQPVKAQVIWADVQSRLDQLDLNRHENHLNNAGMKPEHTISKHVTCSDATIFGAESRNGYCSEQALKNRCIYELSRPNTNNQPQSPFANASAYGSVKQAQEYVALAMNSDQARVLRFLNTNRLGTQIEVPSSNWYFSSGRSVLCSNPGAGAVKVKRFKVLLKKSAQMPGGWYVWTSYPTP